MGSSVLDVEFVLRQNNSNTSFRLGRLKGSNGRRLGLDSTEVDEIMAWIDEKSGLWGVEPLTIYNYLNTGDNVAEDLVHSSRTKSGHSDDVLSLPPSTLRVIGKQIPGREGLQRVVAEAIVINKLGSAGVSSLLRDIRDMTDEEAAGYVGSVDFAAYKDKLAKEEVFRYKESELVRTGRVRESSRVRPLVEVAAVSSIKVDFLLDEGDQEPKVMTSIAEDLRRVGNELIAKAAEIDQALSGESSKASANVQKQTREISDFTDMLSRFLLEPSTPFDIRTERETDAATRAVSRGRGSPDAISRLSELVESYRAGLK